ncbi:MAG: ABC transporter ATP-binding protein [Candidatus Dojkabacteria bacterium]|nr:ABC transporter ATP-binding protein [Candidatus Dojkabacteria bacterium]
MNTIEVRNLKKYFGKTKAVNDVSFDVPKGQIVGFLGPNGAGKTTTIRCILDFIRPDGGYIKVFGRDSIEQSHELKKDIGYLSGEVSLYESWTGREHIDFVKNFRKEKIDEGFLMKKLDIDLDKRTGNLSTGNKQKLALMLALMHKPKLLILDEPTTGLDPLLQETIHDVLKTEAEKGTTIFLSSHNLPEVERLCSRVIVIREGELAGEERVDDLRKKKLYTVNVFFEGKVPTGEFGNNGIYVSRVMEDGLVLDVRGDIRPLLKKLEAFKIKDIEILHTDLEKVFLEFYK